MYIKPCPKCGRMPKIDELHKVNGMRRRLCECPNFDCVLPCTRPNGWFKWGFIYVGEGDDNNIYKVWNAGVTEWEKHQIEEFGAQPMAWDDSWKKAVPEGSWIE